jgi:hypothetical protein
MISTLDLNKI